MTSVWWKLFWQPAIADNSRGRGTEPRWYILETFDVKNPQVVKFFLQQGVTVNKGAYYISIENAMDGFSII